MKRVLPPSVLGQPWLKANFNNHLVNNQTIETVINL